MCKFLVAWVFHPHPAIKNIPPGPDAFAALFELCRALMCVKLFSHFAAVVNWKLFQKSDNTPRAKCNHFNAVWQKR